jgi:hypothetical protein
MLRIPLPSASLEISWIIKTHDRSSVHWPSLPIKKLRFESCSLLHLLAEWGNGGALAVAPLETALISNVPTSTRFISLTTISILHSQNTLNLERTATAFTNNNNNNNNNNNAVIKSYEA